MGREGGREGGGEAVGWLSKCLCELGSGLKKTLSLFFFYFFVAQWRIEGKGDRGG